MDLFSGADPAWRRSFELAWAAFQVGSLAVGAALVDERGEIVSTGRNRFGERTGPDGQLAGSRIAHAEVNALATLPPGDYTGYTLYTTLEPCLLCTAALRLSHVGTVRYAAADPLWSDLVRIPGLSEQMSRRWTRREGPLPGPLGTWGALLPLIAAVEGDIQSVRDAHAETMPELLALAREWAGPKADHLRTVDLETAWASVWPDLAPLSR